MSRGFKGFSELLGAAKVDGDLMLCERHITLGLLKKKKHNPFLDHF
jgi:hypothetical protein